MKKYFRKLNLYLHHRRYHLSIKELLVYDTIMRFKPKERELMGKKIYFFLDKEKLEEGLRCAKEKYGLRFTDLSAVTEVFLDGIYSVYEDFIPGKGQTVIDVGAQYGDYTILCNKIYGSKVYAFEPLPQNFREIKKNLRLNGLQNSDSIKIFNVALADKNRSGTADYANNMVNNMGEGTKIKIRFRTLDSYGFKPDILKIDVEGFEIGVLNGAMNTIKKYRPKIIIETHGDELEKKVKDILTDQGYTLKQRGRSIFNKEFGKVTNLFFV